MNRFLRNLGAGRYMIFYLLLFLVFKEWFHSIGDYYIKYECSCDGKRNYPIDVNFAQTRIPFDATYVVSAARDCYDKDGYFATFFPLDMVFPVVYSLLWLSMINLSPFRKKWIFQLLYMTVLFGALFDYGEDFSFAWYLCHQSDHFFAVLTGIFTTLKTCVLIFNGLSAIILFLAWAGQRYSRWIIAPRS